MTTTDSQQAKEAYLKVGNYKKNILEAVNEAKDYISTTNCPLLNIEISGLNMLDALKGILHAANDFYLYDQFFEIYNRLFYA